MYGSILKNGLAAGLFAVGLGVTSAAAFVGQPTTSSTLGWETAAIPAAMCGYTCRGGGRYIPGPPQVCAERGLEYCGPSRRPLVGVETPGGGVGIYGPGGGGGYGGSNCRTVTIERDDGSVRKIRRCD